MQCNIEMQVVNKSDIEKRLLYYWSRLYGKSIKFHSTVLTDALEIHIIELPKILKKIEDGKIVGMEEGKKEGIKKGKEEGKKAGREEGRKGCRCRL